MKVEDIDDAEMAAFLQEHEARKAMQRRRDLAIAARGVEALKLNDVEAFIKVARAVSPLNGWRLFFQRVAKLSHVSVSAEIQQAFFHFWIEHKSIANNVDNDLLTIAALRVLLPQYKGPPLQLFRGEVEAKVRYRRWGISWTSNIAVAEKFTTDMHQLAVGGSVVLATWAPVEAIIATTVEYGDPYHECEYLVDRRQLRDVHVRARFEQRR